MTYAGAAGQTEAEMAKTLYFQMPKDQLHDGMRTMQAFWTTPDKETGIQLNQANRLWGQQNYEFLPTFLQVTRDNYDAELARLDFAQSEHSRQTINGWVEEQTENKITDLLPMGVLSPDTKLVLTNAVYFHGIWADPFEKEGTKEEDFHLSATDNIKVPMMHRWDEFLYGAIDDLQILERNADLPGRSSLCVHDAGQSQRWDPVPRQNQQSAGVVSCSTGAETTMSP